MPYKPPKKSGWNMALLQELLNRPVPPKPEPRTPQPDQPQLDLNDPQYIGALATGNLPFQQAYAQLPGDVGTLASNYGFTTNFTPGQADPNTGLAGDPTIQVTGIDTSNPYSRAALLQKSYDQTKAGNVTSLGARGQLYSGALQNAQTTAGKAFDTGSEQLRSSFNDVIHGWIGNLGSARLGAGAAKTSALGDLTQKGIDSAPPLSFGGVPYERDEYGNLRPIAGSTPTAESVMKSGSLLGTGFASGKPPKRKRKL